MPEGIRIEGEWDAAKMASLQRKLKDRRTRLGPMCQVAADPVEAFISEYGITLAREAKRRAPRYTGRLAGSIEARFNAGHMSVGSRLGYAAPVHNGSRPHWPPMRAITPWARAHGIPPFLVARKIARDGTPAHPFLSEAQEHVEQQLPRMLRDTASRIQVLWGAP